MWQVRKEPRLEKQEVQWAITFFPKCRNVGTNQYEIIKISNAKKNNVCRVEVLLDR